MFNFWKKQDQDPFLMEMPKTPKIKLEVKEATMERNVETNVETNVSRTYFEVWGDSLSMIEFFKKTTMALVFVNILLLVLLKRSQQKPPLVIRVDEVGRAEAIKDINTTVVLTKPEVLNFVRLFMKYFQERNFYTWKENLVEAGAMMTPDFKERMNKENHLDEETSAIEMNKLTSKLNLSDIVVTRETNDHLLITLKGWRQITSYEDSTFLKEIIFQSELAIKKVPRTTETPYGLQVDTYKQEILKNG